MADLNEEVATLEGAAHAELKGAAWHRQQAQFLTGETRKAELKEAEELARRAATTMDRYADALAREAEKTQQTKGHLTLVQGG